MTIGLLGGSFNPVHIGHMMLASYLQQYAGFDEVWLMLSPLNPLKVNSTELIPDVYRLKMLDMALGDTKGLRVNDIELSMPRPSYTINTLRYLSKRYPQHSFKGGQLRYFSSGRMPRTYCRTMAWSYILGPAIRWALSMTTASR